jgi:hypothetical protein
VTFYRTAERDAFVTLGRSPFRDLWLLRGLVRWHASCNREGMYNPTCHPISTALAAQWSLVGLPVFSGKSSTFVQRSMARGRSWLELSYSADNKRWNVTAYKTRREALAGMFGTPGEPFERFAPGEPMDLSGL